MEKEVLYSREARDKIFNGIDKIYNAIKITIGPKGRNVVIDKNKYPIIVNDGITIAKNFKLKNNRFENIGAKLIRQAANKTEKNAGDGTTGTTILTYEIIKNGLKYINDNYNPTPIKKYLNKFKKIIIEEIEKQSIKINNESQIEQIATISANNDKEIGKIIKEAIKNNWQNSVINVENSNTEETKIRTVDGMHIERKILSPYFITNESKMVADFDNPYIFLIDSKVFKLKTILPALQKASENDKPILIIVREIEGEALSGLVVNAMKGNLKVAAIKAPGFGDIRKEYFKDIAVYTGGEIISDDYGININDFDPELHLGSAKKVICGEDTVIREGNKNNKKFEERLNYLKEKIKNNDVSFYEKERISKRIGNLSSSVTIIKVGANTEVELNEKKLRIEDSLNATKSAIEKGIVLGGGLTLLKISQKLKKIKSDDEYENKTLKILINALSAPIKQIIKNAGDNPDIIIHKIIESNMELGYNANKNKLSNLMDDGVIDPAKVIINIINNSISVAGLILTTEVILSERKNTNIYGSYLEDE